MNRTAAYINSLDMGNTAFLDAIERRARKEHVPVLRTESQIFMKSLLQLAGPASVLEVGTAVGFSALLMRTYNPVPCHITTIENDEKRISAARANFAASGWEADFTLLAGDAAQILPTLDGPFDFIFMDAAKGQYLHFLPEALRLLADGGVLLSDNVLQEGDVLESRYAVTRRDRTIHKRMREYLYTLTHSEQLVTSVLPVGDGMALSVKKVSGEQN